MANEYRFVKQAMMRFLTDKGIVPIGQAYDYAPKPTDIQTFPVIIVRSSSANKFTTLDGDGPSNNDFHLLLGIMTRAVDSQQASHELDDLLKNVDNAIAQYGVKGLPTDGLTDSGWEKITRLQQPTTFDPAIMDVVGFVVYGVSAGVLITEKTAQTQG